MRFLRARGELQRSSGDGGVDTHSVQIHKRLAARSRHKTRSGNRLDAGWNLLVERGSRTAGASGAVVRSTENN